MDATITVEQAAELLGVSRGTAYRAVATGQLPTIRVGRRLRVKRAPLERMLEIAPDPSAEPAQEGGER